MTALHSNTVQLLVISGLDRFSLVRHALGAVPAFGTVAIAAAERRLLTGDGVARIVAQELSRVASRVRAHAPVHSTAGSWLSARSTNWSAVDIGAKAGRLNRVWLPSPLVEASSIVAVNELTSDQTATAPIAIGLWASFAHPRQRTGARLSNLRDGLTAEIALAINPTLILLFAESDGLPLLIAADDQIAAEVAGLALMQRLRAADDEPIGPWEYPLVQRATELGIGVLTPGSIRAERLWLGEQPSHEHRRFDRFSAELLARIGVKIGG